MKLISLIFFCCMQNCISQPSLPQFKQLKLNNDNNWGIFTYEQQQDFYNGNLISGKISVPQTIAENNVDLVFDENFSGLQLDPIKWNLPHEIQNHSDLHVVTTNDLGHKVGPAFIGWASFPDNYEFTGNSVKLIAKEITPYQELKCIDYLENNTIMGDGKPNKRLHKYSFGSLETNHNYKYGYYEARIKLPTIENTWPSFWFFENTTEIDVFEIGRGAHIKPKEFFPNDGITIFEASSRVNMTYHLWNHNIGSSISENAEMNIIGKGSAPYPIDNQWHTWGFLWDNFRMTWGIDGKELYTIYHYVLKFNNSIFIPILNNQQLQAVFNSNLLSKLNENYGYPREQSKLMFGHNVTNFKYYQFSQNGKSYAYNDFTNSDLAYSLGTLPKSIEIDYVKIYAFRNCNTDLNFCDGKDLPTHILGKTVTIGSPNYNISPCNQVVKSKGGCFGEPLCSIKNDNALQYVHCVATNKISLKPGFKVEKGAYFHGKIENCNTANLRTGNNLPEGLQNVINNQAYEDSLFYAQLNALNEIPEDSISNVILKEGLMVYPNPTKGIVNLNLLEIPTTVYNLQVSDIYGRLIYSKVLGNKEQKLQVNISGNASGVYFLQLYNETNSVVRKIILE